MHDSATMLTYINTILRFNNLTKAAKQLHVSQPYLTQTIQRLEKQLGIKLLDRSTTHFSLTREGEFYYQYLQNTYRQKLEFETKLSLDKQLIYFGMTDELSKSFVSNILSNFTPIKNERIMLIDNLKIADLYLTSTFENINYQDKFINHNENYYLVVPEKNSLYHNRQNILKDEISGDLLSQPLVLNFANSNFVLQASNLFKEFHVKPHVIIQTDSFAAAMNISANSKYLTILPATFAYTIQNVNLYPLTDYFLNNTYTLFIKAKNPTTIKSDFSKY